MSKFNLAQINIAKAKAPLDSEIMKGFVERLDEINVLADAAPGFVWRLQSEEGDATSIQAFKDPLILVNMSVWENLESLKEYVYKSLHVDVLRGRKQWFDKLEHMHQALWWIPTGHIPTVEEGKEKLQLLDKTGPSESAFTFSKPFDHE